VALGLLLLAAFSVVMWRYDFRSEEPRHKEAIASLQNDLRDRDKLSRVLEELNQARAGIERVAAQGKVDDSVGQSLDQSLGGLVAAGEDIFAGQDNPFRQLSGDVGEFFKIAGQLVLYESKLNEFISGFKIYFQGFQQNVAKWKETTAAAIAADGKVVNT